MAIIVKSNDGAMGEPIPVGVHKAVCFKVIDLGMQEGFQGKMQHKLVVLWELDCRRQEGEFAGKRFLATKEYTASISEKAHLRKDLESWRGRAFTVEELEGFEMDNVVGANCQLNMVEITTKAGKKWTAIAAIMPIGKGTEKMTPEIEPEYLPNWIKEKLGVTAPNGEGAAEPVFNDDIPF
jgi:hypothetical protein